MNMSDFNSLISNQHECFAVALRGKSQNDSIYLKYAIFFRGLLIREKMDAWKLYHKHGNTLLLKKVNFIST